MTSRPKVDDPNPRFCHLQTPFLTNLMGLIGYTIRPIDVQVGATFQSKPLQGVNVPGIASQSLAANYVVSNALIAPSLGRNLSGGTANVTVNLVEPGTLYGDRVNQLDLRVAKRFYVRPPPRPGWPRRLQRAELERGPGLQPDLRHELADAAVGPGRTLRQSQRAVRFLKALACRPSGCDRGRSERTVHLHQSDFVARPSGRAVSG